MKWIFSGWLSMRGESVPDAYRKEFEIQLEKDLIARQYPALVFYPLIWFLIGTTILLLNATPQKLIWVLVIFIGLLAVSVLRYVLIRKQLANTGKKHADHFAYVDIGVAVTAFSWSIVTTLTLLPTPLNEHYTIIMTSTIGLCSGAIITLSIRQRTVNLFILFLFFLPVVASALGYSVTHSGLPALMVVFAIAMSVISQLPRGEYERAILSNLQLKEQTLQLIELTNRDTLTGLHNRRYFDALIEQELKRANRMAYPLSLLLVDIDKFKGINDQYGHLVGDLCLQHVSQLLCNGLHRAGDTIARIGGEEFAIIMLGADAKEGQAMSEKLRLHISNVPFLYESEKIPITISIGGVTVAPGLTDSPHYLINLADNALYRSKNEGRNRVSWGQERLSDGH
jgi:diguanylate cyclase (GGDEF)-like protein